MMDAAAQLYLLGDRDRMAPNYLRLELRGWGLGCKAAPRLPIGARLLWKSSSSAWRQASLELLGGSGVWWWQCWRPWGVEWRECWWKAGRELVSANTMAWAAEREL